MRASLGEGQLSKMLTVNEVAALLQVHPTTVRRWEKEGHLKSYRLGPKGIIRFKGGDISEFIECTSSSQLS